MIGLASIAGLPWRVIGAVAVAAAIYGAGFSAGTSRAGIEALRAERDAARRDLAILETMAAESAAIAAAADAAREAAEQKVTEYANSLSPDSACLLTDADLRGLRSIVQ